MTDGMHLGDSVEVVTDRFAAQGVEAGAIGHIVDQWADGGSDVEIMDPRTREFVARIHAQPDDLQLYDGTDLADGPREHGLLFGRGDDLGEPVGGAPAPPGTQFAGMNGAGNWVWGDSEPPPEGPIDGDIPWELREEPPTPPAPPAPPTGPIFH